jgi:hypothetical protein
MLVALTDQTETVLPPKKVADGPKDTITLGAVAKVLAGKVIVAVTPEFAAAVIEPVP